MDGAAVRAARNRAFWLLLKFSPSTPCAPSLSPTQAPQAFQDELLQLCGRAHDAADVYRAIEAVHAAGVPSWSLDLMSGLPQVGF